MAFASRWTFFVPVFELNQLQTDVFPGKDDDKTIDACNLCCCKKLTSGDDPVCCACD